MSFPKRVPPYDVFFSSNIHDEILTFPGQLPSLSMRYIHLTFTDPKVRSLLLMDGMTFKVGEEDYYDVYADWWPSPAGAPATYKVEDKSLIKGAKMQVLTKVGGKWGVDKEIGKSWSPIDGWTIEGYDTYCRQRSYARIEEMVIILSYSDISSPGKTFTPQGKDPLLYASDIFCGTVKGNAQLSKTYGGFYNNDFTETLTITDFTHDDYEYSDNPNIPKDNNTYTYIDSGAISGTNYELKSGTLNWTLTGASGGCSYSGQYTLSASDVLLDSNKIDIQNFISAFDKGNGYRTYNFNGFTDFYEGMYYEYSASGEFVSSRYYEGLKADVNVECRDINGDVSKSYIEPWTIDFRFDRPSQQFTDGGSRIDGTYDCDGCSGTWSLVSQSE